jgi:cytochrome c oxidase subunit 3
MPNTITIDEVELNVPTYGGTGRGRDDTGGTGGGDDGSGSGAGKPIPQRTYVTGVTVGLAGVVMLFMALVSALIVRKGSSNDWATLIMPRVLWLNTAILIASSCTVVRARRLLASSDLVGFRRWWLATTMLGLLFLVGQLIAWHTLVIDGLYIDSNPSSSFFYVLTAFHGLHLLGGVIGLLYVALWPAKRKRQMAITEAAAMYWHFMDGLWVFIFLLFYIGK